MRSRTVRAIVARGLLGAALLVPGREVDGRLAADLGTPQADPATDRGRRYLHEAASLYGPGVVPPSPAATPDDDATGAGPWLGAIAIGVALIVGVVWLVRRPDGPD